jgi:hypothetical protein
MAATNFSFCANDEKEVMTMAERMINFFIFVFLKALLSLCHRRKEKQGLF